MLQFKSCPRCIEGDLFEDRDVRGPFMRCLQCAHYLTDEQEAALRSGIRTRAGERSQGFSWGRGRAVAGSQ